MARVKDLTGMVFERLTVLRRAGRNKHGHVLWFCRCECGEEKVVVGGNLRSGNSTSCGCYHREVSAEIGKANYKGFNKYYIVDKVVHILCENHRGEVVGKGLLDEHHLERAKALGRWSQDDKGYLYTYVRGEDGKRKKVWLHDLVLPDKPGCERDHINRLPWDNRDANVRYCTRQQNIANTVPRSKSGYKGVYPHGKNWQVLIQKDGKQYSLGTYPTPEEAALVYNEKALEFFGEFAYMNTVPEVF